MKAIFNEEIYEIKKRYNYITVLFLNKPKPFANRITTDIMIVQNTKLIFMEESDEQLQKTLFE